MTATDFRSDHTLLPIAALATFLIPAAAVLLLAGAIPVTVTTPAYSEGITALAYGEPLTAGAGIMAAVIAAALAGRSHRTWLISLFGLLVPMVLLAFFGSSGYFGAVTVSSYLLLRCVLVIGAGVALGAAFSRAWTHASAIPAVAAVSGLGVSMLLVEVIARPGSGIIPGAYLLGSTGGATFFTWVILTGAIAVATVAMIVDAPPPASLSRARMPRSVPGLVFIAAALTSLQVLGVDVLARTALFWPPLGRFTAAAAVIGLLFVATWIAAMWLGLQDSPWSGALILVTSAFAAAALPVVSEAPRIGAQWMLLIPAALFTAAVAAGVTQRHRGYHAVNGLLFLAAVPVIGLIAGGTAFAVLLQLALLAVGGGFAIGVCLPGAGPAATVLTLGVPLTAQTYGALFGASPSSGAVPATPLSASAVEVPHSWWAVIPEGSGSILAVSLIGLCGVGVLAVGYSAYRLARRRWLTSR
ncbi:hypothetical protein [Hoyosella subflava]|uniref:Uncharacterized protein n=1 Tax=Hoyosella subflava (strain DSM 45089 / JCM 17490 / NBRC 109087 / DQS3-9A1) TaxID=443218 RepID=F6EJG8_HOYSD|nr:hypothetical protein [Hoyosella subflava]AEF39017.1 hypothetical protein AS9A_0562 [Hoyosella subflava DQS3-9A1]